MKTKTALARRAIVQSDEVDPVKDVIGRDIGRNTSSYRNEYGLTERQEEFARRVANGATLSDAYKQSYDCSNSQMSTIYSQASKMVDHPMVAARIRTLMSIKAEKTHALDAMRIRQHVFDRLMIESVDADSPAQARINALVALGKIDVVSMFSEQKGLPKVEERSPSEITARLEELIKRSFTGVALGAGTKSTGLTDDPREAGEERGKRETDYPSDNNNKDDTNDE